MQKGTEYKLASCSPSYDDANRRQWEYDLYLKNIKDRANRVVQGVKPDGREKDYQKLTIELFLAFGWVVYVATPGGGNRGVGIPDLQMWHEDCGEALFVELKAGSRLRKEQVAWGDMLKRGGIEYDVWHFPRDGGKITKIIESHHVRHLTKGTRDTWKQGEAASLPVLPTRFPVRV